MPQNQQAVLSPSEAANQSHYPSLNGLRAVSIILVVMSHLRLFTNTVAITIFNGALGVNIFFVISGFLITSLCLREINATGDLSLKNFYTRRVLRIFPVAYLYLLVIFVLNLYFGLDVKWYQFLGAGLYLMNFSYFRANGFSWYTGHYWSLSVEEQFYIIFPFILKKSIKVFWIAILFVVFGLLILCTLQEVIPAINHGPVYYFTHYFIKFQSIAVGCLFSLLTFRKAFDHQLFSRTRVIGNLVAIVLIFYIHFEDFYRITSVYTNLLIAFLTAYVVVSNIVPSRDVIYRFLNLKFMSFIGVLSYSIYIWQQLIVSDASQLSPFLVKAPYKYIWLIVVPVLSYYGFERYFLKLKKRFKVINSSEEETGTGAIGVQKA